MCPLKVAQQEQQRQHHLIIIEQQQQQQAAAEREARRLEEERRRVEVKKVVTKKEPSKKKVLLSSSLSELHALRLRLEDVEGTLSQHIHICLGDDGMNDCGLKITQLEVDTKTHKYTKIKQAWGIDGICVHAALQSLQCDATSLREEYLTLKLRILKELQDMNDGDKSQFLSSELGIIDQRLNRLESSSSAYLQR